MNAHSSEFELIEEIRRRVPIHPAVEIGIGDDAACMAPGDQSRLVATDMLMEGVHFLIPPATPRLVAFKAVNVNLSDIAAMGGIPTAAFVSICWPQSCGSIFRDEFCRAIEEACARFHVALAGGDTNAWNGPLVVSITVVGKLEGPPWLRSGAKPGDSIMVTGELGGSLAGKHLDFTPRVREAQLLRQAASPSSMIDISDGLSADLFHILDESHVGALIHEDLIPISAAAHNCHDHLTPLEHALGDGEDFELLFTLEPSAAQSLLKSPPFSTKLTRIGEILEHQPDPGLTTKLVLNSGAVAPLSRRGWTHSLNGSSDTSER